MSCHICPVLAVLSHLPCPVPAVLPWLSCCGCPILVALSQLSYLTVLWYLSCHGCPAAIVLSQLSYPAGLAHLSWLHVSLLFPSFSVPAVLSMLSCSDCPVYLFHPGCPAKLGIRNLSPHLRNSAILRTTKSFAELRS
jgi:hypothetical protein